LGTMPGLIAYLREHLDRIRVLPEVDGRTAVRAIAALLGIAEERILAGGGTTQFIYAACAALTSRRVLIIGPTYADYANGCRVHGLEPDFFLATPATGFAPDLELLDGVLGGYDTVFLCNPNNPTGQLIPHAALLQLCRRHPRVRFIVDESYLPFVASEDNMGMGHCGLDNVLVLWSVSKIFGIPGLRAGFLIANPPVIDGFRRYMQPWCVNSLAQEAVCFLGDNVAAAGAFIAQTCRHLDREGLLFRERLRSARLTLHPSRTSYFLMALPEQLSAESVCRALARQRFLIRNCSNFHGLNGRYIRVALKDSATNKAVVGHLLAAVGTEPDGE